MTALNIVKNTSDGSTKAARMEDPHEFQYILWNKETEGGELYHQCTDNPNLAMEWAGQLKFAEDILAWDWIIHYADGTSEFVMRSIWMSGDVPADTSCR